MRLGLGDTIIEVSLFDTGSLSVPHKSIKCVVVSKISKSKCRRVKVLNAIKVSKASKVCYRTNKILNYFRILVNWDILSFTFLLKHLSHNFLNEYEIHVASAYMHFIQFMVITFCSIHDGTCYYLLESHSSYHILIPWKVL